MRRAAAVLFFFLAAVASAVIIDRIAIVVGKSIIKDSDIERDIRVTAFLNRVPADLSQTSRKSSAQRLLDQIFIRQEIVAGDYEHATLEEADAQLAKLKQDRYRSGAAFDAALNRYGITDQELRFQLRWQLTVLKFISLRFKPAAYIAPQEIDTYFAQHTAALERQYPGKRSAEALEPEITNVLAEQKVNQLFFQWLDDQRKNAKVQYLEAGLQ